MTNKLRRKIKRLFSQAQSSRLELGVATILFVFGTIYAVIAPPLWGLDEVSHFNRALEVSRGQTVPQQNSKGDMGNDVPSSLSELEYYVYNDLLDDRKEYQQTLSRGDVTSLGNYQMLGARTLSKKDEPTRITATYSPVAYVGPAIAIFIGEALNFSIHNLIIFARIGGLLTFICLVAGSLYLLRNTRMKWVIAAVSLFPVVVFQASTVSADTLTNGMGLALFAIVYRYLVAGKQPQRRTLLVIAVALSILLPLVKTNNLALSLMIFAIPASMIARDRLVGNMAKAGVFGVSTIAAYLWMRTSTSLQATAISMRPDGLPVDPAGQVSYLLEHPIGGFAVFSKSIIGNSNDYLQSMIGTLGWNLAPLPVVFVVLALIVLLFTVLYAKQEIAMISKRSKIFLSILGFAGIGSTFLAMYLAFNPVGHPVIDGVNGRYFIPFLPLIVLGAASVLPDVTIKQTTIRRSVFVMVAVLAVSLTFYVTVTY